MNSKNPEGFIPSNGGYRTLYTYKNSEIIYEGTVYFTKRFFGKYDRTINQMVQAARSGKQNIAEGSVDSATSKEMELKLTNVARASLEELLIDYGDFIRTNKLSLWDKDSLPALRVREITKTKNATYENFREEIEHANPEVCANTMYTLIKVTTYLLSNQIKRLQSDFLVEGGLRERMTKARLKIRNNS